MKKKFAQIWVINMRKIKVYVAFLVTAAVLSVKSREVKEVVSRLISDASSRLVEKSIQVERSVERTMHIENFDNLWTEEI